MHAQEILGRYFLIAILDRELQQALAVMRLREQPIGAVVDTPASGEFQGEIEGAMIKAIAAANAIAFTVAEG